MGVSWYYVALVSAALGATISLSLTLLALFYLKKKRRTQTHEERRHEFMRKNSRHLTIADVAGRVSRPESINWLNVMIKLFYETNRKSIFLKIKEMLDPILSEVKPTYISNIALTQFDFGASTPVIEGVTGSQESSEQDKRFYILEIRPVISSNDFKMMFKVSS
eukprot:sb/3472603/